MAYIVMACIVAAYIGMAYESRERIKRLHTVELIDLPILRVDIRIGMRIDMRLDM